MGAIRDCSGGHLLMGRPATKYTKYLDAYYTQKGSAQKRGIQWNITIDEWVNWWGDDYQYRGRKKDQLVMARYGDVGPYETSNIYKSTAADNAGLPRRNKKRPEVTGKKHGKARAVITPAGEFDTIVEASKHYQITPEGIIYRIKRSQGFSYKEETK